MDREETYHRIHAAMWIDRLLATDEGSHRLNEAVDELWPYALGVLEQERRGDLAEPVGRDEVEAVERGTHADGFAALHEEMTMVGRSIPGAAW